jgi:hypothetical protein
MQTLRTVARDKNACTSAIDTDDDEVDDVDDDDDVALFMLRLPTA